MMSNLKRKEEKDISALWEKRICECENSGMSVSGWCEKNGIAKSAFYNWKRKLSANDVVPVFTEITDLCHVSGCASSAVIKVVADGFSAEIFPGADPACIKALISAIKSC